MAVQEVAGREAAVPEAVEALAATFTKMNEGCLLSRRSAPAVVLEELVPAACAASYFCACPAGTLSPLLLHGRAAEAAAASAAAAAVVVAAEAPAGGMAVGAAEVEYEVGGYGDATSWELSEALAMYSEDKCDEDESDGASSSSCARHQRQRRLELARECRECKAALAARVSGGHGGGGGGGGAGVGGGAWR